MREMNWSWARSGGKGTIREQGNYEEGEVERGHKTWLRKRHRDGRRRVDGEGAKEDRRREKGGGFWKRKERRRERFLEKKDGERMFLED